MEQGMEFQQITPSWRVATRSRIKKWFPERQVHLRTEGRVTFFRISTFAQIFFAILFLSTSGWVGFTSYSYVEHDKIVAGKNNLIANARLAYESLLGEVAEYQNKFNAITSDLEHNHALMLGLVERNASLQQDLRSVSRELENTQDERHDISTAREALIGKLAQIEVEMRALSGHNFALKDNLNNVEGDLQTALSERNQALFEGTRLRRHVTDLETRLGQLQDTHACSRCWPLRLQLPSGLCCCVGKGEKPEDACGTSFGVAPGRSASDYRPSATSRQTRMGTTD